MRGNKVNYPEGYSRGAFRRGLEVCMQMKELKVRWWGIVKEKISCNIGI